MCPARVLSRLTIVIVLLGIPAEGLWGQEPLPGNARPDAAGQTSITAAGPAAEPGDAERIVEGRPALYTFKRAIHPLTWLEAAPDPLFRSAENAGARRLMTRKPDSGKT